MTAKRVGGPVLARRVTGAREAWVRVDKFTADVNEAIQMMRDTAESLSATRIGDVIAFRLSSAIPSRGRGVFYWYLSPTMGVVEIPPATPYWGTADEIPRGRDWLSWWMESTNVGWMLEALSRVSKQHAEHGVALLIERGIATAERYARSRLERAKGNTPKETAIMEFLAECESERNFLAANRAEVAQSIPLRDIAASWRGIRAAFFDTDQPIRETSKARAALARRAEGEPLEVPPEFLRIARRGAVFEVEPDAIDAVRRITSDELRADVPLDVLLPLLEREAQRPRADEAERTPAAVPPYEPA